MFKLFDIIDDKIAKAEKDLELALMIKYIAKSKLSAWYMWHNRRSISDLIFVNFQLKLSHEENKK